MSADPQITATVMEHGKEIAAMREKLSSAHRRIDENDRITAGIHKIAVNVETLTVQMKLLTEKLESSIERIEGGLKGQGERIGELEQFAATVGRLKGTVEENAAKVAALEREPAIKWREMTKQITGLVIAAVFGALAAQLF